MDVKIRNNAMVSHDHLIKAAIRRNMPLIRALRLELDDVYQELAITMLGAIESYDPARSNSLGAYLWLKLQYAILDLKAAYRPCGMTGLKGVRVTFTSVECYYDGGGPLGIPDRDSFDEVEISDALAILTADERETFCEKMDGIQHRKKEQRDALASAQEKIRELYLRDDCYASCY